MLVPGRFFNSSKSNQTGAVSVSQSDHLIVFDVTSSCGPTGEQILQFNMSYSRFATQLDLHSLDWRRGCHASGATTCINAVAWHPTRDLVAVLTDNGVLVVDPSEFFLGRTALAEVKLRIKPSDFLGAERGKKTLTAGQAIRLSTLSGMGHAATVVHSLLDRSKVSPEQWASICWGEVGDLHAGGSTSTADEERSSFGGGRSGALVGSARQGPAVPAEKGEKQHFTCRSRVRLCVTSLCGKALVFDILPSIAEWRASLTCVLDPVSLLAENPDFREIRPDHSCFCFLQDTPHLFATSYKNCVVLWDLSQQEGAGVPPAAASSSAGVALPAPTTGGGCEPMKKAGAMKKMKSAASLGDIEKHADHEDEARLTTVAQYKAGHRDTGGLLLGLLKQQDRAALQAAAQRSAPPYQNLKRPRDVVGAVGGGASSKRPKLNDEEDDLLADDPSPANSKPSPKAAAAKAGPKFPAAASPKAGAGPSSEDVCCSLERAAEAEVSHIFRLVEFESPVTAMFSGNGFGDKGEILVGLASGRILAVKVSPSSSSPVLTQHLIYDPAKTPNKTKFRISQRRQAPVHLLRAEGPVVVAAIGDSVLAVHGGKIIFEYLHGSTVCSLAVDLFSRTLVSVDNFGVACFWTLEKTRSEKSLQRLALAKQDALLSGGAAPLRRTGSAASSGPKKALDEVAPAEEVVENDFVYCVTSPPKFVRAAPEPLEYHAIGNQPTHYRPTFDHVLPAPGFALSPSGQLCCCLTSANKEMAQQYRRQMNAGGNISELWFAVTKRGGTTDVVLPPEEDFGLPEKDLDGAARGRAAASSSKQAASSKKTEKPAPKDFGPFGALVKRFLERGGKDFLDSSEATFLFLREDTHPTGLHRFSAEKLIEEACLSPDINKDLLAKQLSNAAAVLLARCRLTPTHQIEGVLDAKTLSRSSSANSSSGGAKPSPKNAPKPSPKSVPKPSGRAAAAKNGAKKACGLCSSALSMGPLQDFWVCDSGHRFPVCQATGVPVLRQEHRVCTVCQRVRVVEEVVLGGEQFELPEARLERCNFCLGTCLPSRVPCE